MFSLGDSSKGSVLQAVKLDRCCTIFVIKMLSLCRLYCKYCDAHTFLLIPSLHLHLEVLQTSLLFSKDYGLLSFVRKSLASDEVDIEKHPVNNNLVTSNVPTLTETSLFQFRDTRVDIICFLEKFLDRVSTKVKGWEKTYAIDIKVSSPYRTRLKDLSATDFYSARCKNFILQLVYGFILFFHVHIYMRKNYLTKTETFTK